MTLYLFITGRVQRLPQKQQKRVCLSDQLLLSATSYKPWHWEGRGVLSWHGVCRTKFFYHHILHFEFDGLSLKCTVRHCCFGVSGALDHMFKCVSFLFCSQAAFNILKLLSELDQQPSPANGPISGSVDGGLFESFFFNRKDRPS